MKVKYSNRVCLVDLFDQTPLPQFNFMTSDQTEEIRRRLDDDLSLKKFDRDYRSTGEAATQFFQDLFVQVLNFEDTTSPLGDATWQDIPVHEWPSATQAKAARLFAESRNFRLIYVELENLTRTAERNTIQSLTRSDRTSGWAIQGSFLTIFHGSDEDIWHLVTPYEEGTDDITTGRPVLRRYTLGEGETHRTVANALSNMDASRGRLAERIDEAFQVKPITEEFYSDYKNAFDTLSEELRRKGLEIEAADRYAHTTLNRLMFFYYLQKKGWIGDRKDFMSWFHDQYRESVAKETFHQEWLSTLFFEGVNRPTGEDINTDIPTNIESAIINLPYLNGGLFQPTEEDKSDIYLSDSTLESVIRGFLEQYNFTVTEESPYDIDVAVDPAMLGKIYESLIAEQERGEAGIFYTPRKEVDIMCRLSLYEQFCDYATNLDDKGRRKIVNFIFAEPQDWASGDVEETDVLKEILHDIRIVDPACGSGAFLVGMKQILTELYRKLGIEPDYDLKERIINENLNGVDIKEWAIRVAEFRLWLSLVEAEDELPQKRPLLPSFTFKLRSGDSLVQKIGDEFVSMERLSRKVSGESKGILDDVKKLKERHFEGEADLREEIRKKEMSLIQTHIDEPWEYMAGHLELDDADIRALRGLYRAEIAYLDEQLVELKRALIESGEWEDTVLLVTADHGENIGDHGMMDHQYCLYDTLVHVPLVVQGGSFDDHGDITGLVSLADIAPTLLDVADIEAPEARSAFQGRSFHPESNSTRHEFVVSEYMAPQPSMDALERHVGDLPPDIYEFDRSLRAIRTEEHKLIRGSDGTTELYDLAADPDETTDVSSQRPVLVERLSESLDEWLDVFEQAETDGDVSIAGERKKQLENLGYIQ